jgi:HSP20 family protein
VTTIKNPLDRKERQSGRQDMAPNIVRLQNTTTATRNYPASPFRLFEDFFNDWALRSTEDRRAESWTPPVDVMEKDGNLLLMASLPGMTEKEIEIKVEGQILTIKGERTSQEATGYVYFQQEGRYGPFSRSFTLPDSANLENIKAEYKNGILLISIPQKAESKPRTIKVNV